MHITAAYYQLLPTRLHDNCCRPVLFPPFEYLYCYARPFEYLHWFDNCCRPVLAPPRRPVLAPRPHLNTCIVMPHPFEYLHCPIKFGFARVDLSIVVDFFFFFFLDQNHIFCLRRFLHRILGPLCRLPDRVCLRFGRLLNQVVCKVQT